MDELSAEKTITEYLRKIYGFSLSKTSTLQDAEDLTQEIVLKLYPALLSEDIENVAAFIWRVAKNTLANYYRGKAKNGIGMPIDDLVETLSNDFNLEKHLENEQTIRRLQREIAYLSKMQRKIVVLFYYENKKQSEIADLLSIAVGTVKWHLFEAKKEIKKGMETMRESSELKFNPIKFSIMGLSGSVGTMGGTSNFFRSTLSQNIAYSVFREAKTINEIADCLGVSPVYLEGEVEFLEEYGFLSKKGSKYLANILIDEPNSEFHQIAKLQEEMYNKAAKLFANDLYDELLNSKLLDNENIVSAYSEDKNFLLWSLIPLTSAVSGEHLIDHKVSFDEVATIRPDGGKNIAYAGFEHIDSPKQKYFDSLLEWHGPCWNANDNYTLWTIDSEWSEKRINDNYQISIQRDLTLMGNYLNDKGLSEDEYAYMVQKGYLKAISDNSGTLTPSLKIIWIKDSETKQRIIDIGSKIKEKYHDEFAKLKAPFIKAVIDSTPKQLKKMQAYGMQHIFFADGWFLIYCMKELVNNGKLKLPTEEQQKSLSTIFMPN